MIVDRPSPNHDARPEAARIDMLLLHYTGMKTARDALFRLCDPAARDSAHYTIDRDGIVYAHVPEERRAWHAGVSFWAGERDVNARSIGIELVNPGHEFGYVPFPEEQMAALIDLASGILQRHPIPPHRVLGHSDVAPARKSDPGELFSWAQLADFGIGLWPHDGGAALGGSLENALSAFGYGVGDAPLETIVTAFQRHFRPGRVDGVADAETRRRLAALLAQLETV